MPAGGIVVAGSTSDTIDGRSAGKVLAVRRFYGDGSLDPTFAATVRPDSPSALFAMPDGRVVGGDVDDFALARPTAAGRPDSTFGVGGRASIPALPTNSISFVTPEGRITSPARAANGEVIAVGTIEYEYKAADVGIVGTGKKPRA